jgi:cell division transport system permease protein
MIRKPIVFSLVREQSLFMTAIMSLLSFLSVLAFGVAISIGTGVIRWNNQWELFATVQTTDAKNVQPVQKIIDKNTDKFESVTVISEKQMQDLMAPWISGNTKILKEYLPTMWEIKFKTKSDLTQFGTEISKNARFLTHASALKSSTSAGWKMILMSGMVLILTLSAIGFCISYIAKNTAMLHRRELEILNQIGASDKFVARQMQLIVAKISTIATSIGFISAMPILLLIMSAAHGTKIGLMSMMTISGFGWTLLITLPISIIIFSIYITRKTTLNILKNS